MGIGDFVRSGVSAMRIARPSDGHRNISCAYQLGHPPLFSQLDVQGDEAAVFRASGRVLGVLGPGRHSLSSTSTPFLEACKSSDQQRYECEVIFVRTEGTRLALDGSVGTLTDSAGHEAEFFVLGTVTVGTSNPASVVTQAIGMGRPGEGVDAIVRERVMAGISSHLRAVFEQAQAAPAQPHTIGPAVLAAGRADQLGIAVLGLDVRAVEISRLVSNQNRPPAGNDAAGLRAEVAAAENLPDHQTCRFGASRIPFWDTTFEMMVHVSVVGHFVGERVPNEHEQWAKDTIKQTLIRAASSWTGTVLDLPGKKDEWSRYVTQVVAPDIAHRAGVRGRVLVEGVQIDSGEEAELRRRRGAQLGR